MKKNSIFTRIAAIFLAAIMLFSEGSIFAAFAAETTTHEECADCENSERIELSGDEVSEILSGESDLNVTFSPEAEAALIQTMDELSRLMEAGQLEYDEENNTYVVTDPNADLSGLNITGIDTTTGEDGTQRVVASVGMPSDETVGGFVLLSEEMTSGEETLTEDAPAEGEPSAENPAEEESTVEESTEEEPTEEEPTEEEPTEKESSDDEATEGGSDEEETDETLDEDAELLWWSSCDHKETKSKNVSYYNTYKKGRKKVDTIPKKGTIVEVLDSDRPSLFGDLYYKVKIKGKSGTYWILADNLKNHECSANSVTQTTEYSQISGNNSKHWKTVTTPAKSCTKCGCNIASKDVDKSKKDHDWNGEGICKLCGYNFKETKDNCKDAVYMVIKDGVTLRSAPYSASTATRTLNDGDSIVVTHTTENAFHSFFNPHVWYLTDKGDWIYSENVEKHSHTYNAESTKTGRCTVCNRLYKYDIIPMADTPFEVAVDYNVPIRKYPYSKSDAVAYTDSATIYTVNAYTNSDPNRNFWSAGSRNDKWYRLEGLGWVKYSDIKEHTKHKYNQTYGGVCSYTGCSEEYTLKPKKVDTLAYETKSANVIARNQPYSIGSTQQTYKYPNTIVRIDREVTNSLKETWQRTTDGYWIKASDLKIHTHTLKVGACTASGCSYVAATNTKSCKKYTGELTLTADVKEKPFSDAKTINTLPPNSCLTINGTCTVEGKIWYRTTSGYFIDSSCVKKHSHNYQGGYCAPCGTYQSWTTTVINPIVVLSKADGTVVREKPYAVAPVTRTLSKNEEIVIVQKCSNSFKKTWYQLVDGTWIFSENVKTTNGAKVTTSNKLAVDKYTLSLLDDCGDPIAGASVNWVGQTYTSDENGKVALAYVTTKTDLTITMTGYDKVSLTDYTMKTGRKDTVTMALTGSFKATEVIMNYLDTDINVLRTSKNLNKYHTQGFFQRDFKITCKVGDSVADKIGKYQLVQGTDVIATTKTGVFEGLDVGDFYSHKTVYLKVFDKNGKERSKQDLRINIFSEGLDGSTPNLDIGFGNMKITIPAACPLIGGFEIKFDPPSIVDYSIDINDDSTTYALEVDLDMFAKKVTKSSSPSKKGDTSDEVYWSDFTAYKQFWNTFKTAKAKGWKTYNDAKLAEEAKELKKNGGKTKVDWDFAIGGYVEKMHGEDIWNGMLYFNIKVAKPLPDYPLPPPAAPLTVGVEFSAEGTIGAKLTIVSAKVTDFSVPLDITGSVEVSLNLGLKNVISASIFGQASLGIEFQLYPIDMEELNIFLRASMGIKAKALGAEVFRFTFLESPIIYIVQEGKFVFFEYDDPYAVLMDSGNYAPIDRSYLYNRSGWYEANAALMEDVSVSISDMDVEVLQSSTYTDLKPQVVTADDGTIMMLYTDDNATRAAIDRTMLVFSLYDPATGQWTEPEPVQDDGTGDYGFSAHSVGEDIYLVWQNARTTHAADADITAVSRNLEVTVAKYDAVAKEFTCIQQLTDNDVYENMPRVSAVNGQVVVSWLTNSDHSIFQSTGENTVWYAVKSEAEYDTNEPYSGIIDTSTLTDEDLEEEILPEDLPEDIVYVEPVDTPWAISSMEPVTDTITSLAVGYMLNNGYVAYTTDGDGNTSTVDDQFIHLIDTATGQLMAYTDKACNVEFTRVHGDNAMTWYNQGNIYYALDPNYAPQILFTDETLSDEESQILYEDVNLGNDYQIISDDQGNMAILSTRNGDSCSNAYVMLYDDANFQWGLPVAVTDQDLYIRDFYGAYHEGTIISIFNRTAIDETTFAESNSLCSAIINDRTDLTISGVAVNTYNLQPLSQTPVWMTVTNNGTNRVEGFTAILYDSLGGEICRQTVTEPLRMGESTPVEFTLTMGETIEQTTYRLEVVPNDVEDDHPENNEYHFDVGIPHLVLEAESQSTETEDIVVLTVTNMGYGELGGSLVLLDDNGAVTDVLVEEFSPVDHDGEYTCAILFSEEYFGGQPNAVFRFGIIPTGTTQVDCETSIYVDKVLPAESATITIEDSNLEDSGEDATLMEATAKTVTGTVANDTENDLTNAILCASAYDVDGVWLDSYTETITLPSEESYSFTAMFLTEADIETVSVTLLDSETMEPLIAAEHITLTYDVIPD